MREISGRFLWCQISWTNWLVLAINAFFLIFKTNTMFMCAIILIWLVWSILWYLGSLLSLLNIYQRNLKFLWLVWLNLWLMWVKNKIWIKWPKGADICWHSINIIRKNLKIVHIYWRRGQQLHGNLFIRRYHWKL